MPRAAKQAAAVEEYDENEGDFEGDDASDDWQPEPEEVNKSKRGPKRKVVTPKGGAKKKIKQEEESEESEEGEDGEGEFDEEEFEEDEGEDSSAKGSGKKAKKTTTTSTTEDPRNFPDRQGVFSLYAYKGDLKDGLRINTNLCLWRRDGQSLLQKYLRSKDNKNNSMIFDSSMVYSCWEDRRRDEYLEVKVKCLNSTGKDSARDSKVELIDVDAIEQIIINEKYNELDLAPYISYADKKKQEESINGTSQNITLEEEEVSEGEE